MVVVVMTTAMRIITLVIVVMMMLVAMTMWVMAFAMFVMMIMIVLVVMMFLFFHIAFYLLNPCSRGSDLVKIKEFGIKDFGERHIAIVTVNDLSFRLDSTKDSANMLTFLS